MWKWWWLSWILVSSAGERLENQLQERLSAAQRNGRYVQPSEHRLEQARILFLKTLRKPSTALQQEWRQIEMILEPMDTVWILREVENQGGGFYLFQNGEGIFDAAIQMPHSLFDLHTGKIGLKFFLEGKFRVGAWNTVNRKSTAVGMGRDSDLAHLEKSFLQSLSAAWARYAPAKPVFQIHGFSRKKRVDPAASRATIVLSDGRTEPQFGIALLSSCLTRTGAGPVALYGRDTLELGAVTNAQKRLLASMGHRGFVHLEFSAAMRGRLRKEKDLRARMMRCLREFTATASSEIEGP